MLISFWSLLDSALRRVYAGCAVLAGCAIIVIALATIVSIGSRAVGSYVPGTTEIAGYGMAASGALGLAHTAINHGHIRVDLVLSLLRARPRQRMEVFALIATTVAVGFAAFSLIGMVRLSQRYGDISSNSDALPLWLPQLPLAVGFILFTISLLHLTVLALVGHGAASAGAEAGQ